MALNIKTNVPSITAQKNLESSSRALGQTYERLSSGLRINRAKDDAAGLAIAEALKADSRIATVAMRNANDGISIIAITDGAISQITSVLSRLAELASQSANGVFSTGQRSALQLEFTALMSEVERIAITTEFNGLKLLSGGASVTFQVGFDGTSLSQISYAGVAATLEALGLAGSGSSIPTFSINDVDCSFPGDLDPGDESFDGVRFSLFEEHIIISTDQLRQYLQTVCKAYVAEHPETERILHEYHQRAI